VPTIVPCSVTGDSRFVAVKVARLASGAASLASPKSRSLAPPDVSMMFPGFRSHRAQAAFRLPGALQNEL
jgi:hypothetical protein